MKVIQPICIFSVTLRLLFKPVIPNFLYCKILFFVWTRYYLSCTMLTAYQWVYIVAILKIEIEIGIIDVNIYFLKFWGLIFTWNFMTSISNCQLFCLHKGDDSYCVCMICSQAISGNLLAKMNRQNASLAHSIFFHPSGWTSAAAFMCTCSHMTHAPPTLIFVVDYSPMQYSPPNLIPRLPTLTVGGVWGHVTTCAHISSCRSPMERNLICWNSIFKIQFFNFCLFGPGNEAA